MDSLDDDATPMIMLRRLSGQTSDANLRAFLGGFGFQGERIDTQSRLFSGGERARLMLALLVWQRPNVLILDEPTNHLDLQMRNALMLALQDFAGALILVSHDRDLIMSVCDELLLVFDGRATEFVGDMADYAEHLRQAKKAHQANQKMDKSIHQQSTNTATGQEICLHDSLSKEDRRKKNAQIREQTAPLRKQIAKLEDRLGKLSDTLAILENELSDARLYEDDYKSELLDKLNHQNTLKSQIDDIEEQLLTAMAELEVLEDELSG